MSGARIEVIAMSPTYRTTIPLREIPGIYRRRLQRLIHAVVFNLVAAACLISIVFLAPMALAATIFNAHRVVTLFGLAVAILVAAYAYWESVAVVLQMRSKDREFGSGTVRWLSK